MHSYTAQKHLLRLASTLSKHLMAQAMLFLFTTTK